MPSRYLGLFALIAFAWVCLGLGIVWTIDPYGVSPLPAAWKPLGDYKPKRRNIDRLIKPYEVWWHKPRTVFLGSSRVLESIDPSALDGTRFAPAYNASVPANMLSLDAARIAQYIRLNRHLKVVVMELFFWNFIYWQPDAPEYGLYEFIENSAALHVSMQTLWDSVLTIKAVLASKERGPYVSTRGNWVNRPDHDAKFLFDAYIPAIMKAEAKLPRVELQPSAFQALDRIVEVCRQNDIELFFLITPNHPYDDYRILSLGYWALLEQWHRKIATYPNVLGASQYTAPLVEPISRKMLYWNDPLHASSKFGDLVLRALQGEKSPDIPPDLLLSVNQQTVTAILLERRSGLERWTADNQTFTEAFDQARTSSGHQSPQQK